MYSPTQGLCTSHTHLTLQQRMHSALAHTQTSRKGREEDGRACTHNYVYIHQRLDHSICYFNVVVTDFGTSLLSFFLLLSHLFFSFVFLVPQISLFAFVSDHTSHLSHPSTSCPVSLLSATPILSFSQPHTRSNTVISTLYSVPSSNSPSIAS